MSRLWEAQQQEALKLGDATLLTGVPLDLKSLSDLRFCSSTNRCVAISVG